MNWEIITVAFPSIAFGFLIGMIFFYKLEDRYYQTNWRVENARLEEKIECLENKLKEVKEDD